MKSTIVNVTKKISDNLYIITEANSIHCYLILGEEKAVLFDVGYGYENICPIIESITDMPVMVVLSHGDPDHGLGSSRFPEVFMHPLDYGKLIINDNEEIKRSSLEYRFRKLPVIKPYVDIDEFCKSSIMNTKVNFLMGGERIDLGGKELEVIHLPGHSYGCIALLDREEKRLFTGDMITQHNIWYFGSNDGQASFIQAVYSYRKIQEMKGEIDFIYPAHGPVGIDTTIVDELLECFEGELEQNYQKDKEFYSFAGDGYQHFYKHVNLIYSDERLGEYLGVVIER